MMINGMKCILKQVSVAFSFIILTFQSIASDQNYEAALQSYHQQEYDVAYIHLKNTLQKDPKNLAAKLLLGKLFTRNGYYDEAIKEFKQALEYKIDIELVLVPLGNVLLFKNEYEEVLTLGEGYKLTRNSQFEWHMLSATAYSELNDLPQAKNEYQKAIQLYPNSIRAINSLAFMNLSNGDYEDALKQTEKSLQISPSDARTWHLKGKVSEAVGDVNSAIESYSRALSINGDDPVAMRSKAYALISANRLEEAKVIAEEIITQTPNDPFAMLLNSWILSRNDNNKLAEGIIENLSNQITLITDQQYKKNNSLLFVKGMTSYIQGDFEQAKTSLAKYVKTSGNDLNAISMLTEIYMSMGQNEAATHLLSKNEEDLLEHLPLALKLANLYLLTGKDFKAEFWLSQLRETYPNEIKIVLISAKALIARNKIASAIKLVEDNSKKYPNNQSIILLHGMLYLQTDRYEEALSISEQLLKHNVRNVDNWNLKAAALIKLEKYQLASDAVENVLAISPKHVAGRFNQAMLFKHTNQHLAAKKILSELVEENPNNSKSIFQLALLESQTGDIESATIRVENLSRTEPNNHNASILLLDLYLQQNKNADALIRVKRLTKEHPLNSDFALKKAEALMASGLLDDAKSQLEKLFALWLNNPEKLYMLSNMQRNVNDLQGALASLQQALTLLPEHLLLNLEYARVNLQLGQVKTAKNTAIEMEQQYGEHENIHLLTGEIFLSEENYDKAHTFYLKAAKLQPDYQLPLARLYELAKRGIKEPVFRSYINDVVKTRPKSNWHRKLLADHLVNQGYWEDARAHYLLLIKQESLSRNPEILNNLANLYMNTDIEKSFDFARKAYKHASSNSQVLDTYGWVLVQKQQYQEAITYLRQAHAIESSNPSIRYHIAYTLWKLERVNESKTEVNYVLNHFDTFPEREEATQLQSKL